MRNLIIASVGAVFGMAMIWSGFNLRLGGPGSGLLLNGPAALIPAAAVGGVVALLLDYIIRKWT